MWGVGSGKSGPTLGGRWSRAGSLPEESSRNQGMPLDCCMVYVAYVVEEAEQVKVDIL